MVLLHSSIGVGFFESDAPPLFRLSSWDMMSQRECKKETKRIDVTGLSSISYYSSRPVFVWVTLCTLDKDDFFFLPSHQGSTPLSPISLSIPGLSNLLHACIFLHSWTFWFAHLDFYTNKPGSDLNPHETPQILLIKCCPFKIFHQKFCTLSQKVGHP